MNKIFRLFSILCATVLSLASCQKETHTLKVTFESPSSDAKVYLDSTYTPHWDAEDKIVINQEIYTISSSSSQTTVTHASDYTAAYPVELVTANSCIGRSAIISVPRVTSYSEINGVQHFYAPMLGYTTGSTIQMKNLCALVRVAVTPKIAGTLKSIELTNLKVDKLAGDKLFTLNNSGTISSAFQGNYSFSATLCDINKSISPSAPSYFIIPILPHNSSGVQFRVRIYLEENGVIKCYQRSQRSTMNLYRSEITTIPADLSQEEWTEVATHGFTIDANGTKVMFSPGNLQFKPSTQTYRFAPHQYDLQGDINNANITSTYDHWIDIFAFRSGSNLTNIVFTKNPADYQGAFQDWGTAYGGGYRTLSFPEWDYLVKYPSGRRRANATVAGVKGVLLFPDDYWLNHDISRFNMTNTSWNDNTYTAEEFASLEDKDDSGQVNGCVFLPMGGYKKGPDYLNTGINEARYWSSSYKDDTSATGATIYSNEVHSTSSSRYFGRYVRLVKNLSQNK